jgi:predicted dehydrogenase
MTRILRFGIVGCGTIAATHADAIAQLPSAQLVACCDIIPERATLFAQRHGLTAEHTYSGLPALLKDPAVDVVTVCTPSGTHAKIGIAAMRSGCPVLVEKPMDVSLDAVMQLENAGRETGMALGGSLVLCEAQVKWYRSQEYYDSGDWRGTWELDGGGALINQGIHTVDLMRWIMGPVHSVYAVSKTLIHQRIEVEDVICATMIFKSGAVGNLSASTSVYPGFPAQLNIHGSKGSIVIQGDALASVEFADGAPDGEDIDILLAEGIAGHAIDVAQGGTRAAETKKTLLTDLVTSTWGDAHRAQIADFIESVNTGRKPRVDGQAGKEAVSLVLAAYESCRTGKPVEMF